MRWRQVCGDTKIFVALQICVVPSVCIDVAVHVPVNEMVFVKTKREDLCGSMWHHEASRSGIVLLPV